MICDTLQDSYHDNILCGAEIKTKNDTTYTQPGSLLPEETHCTAAQKIEEGNTATLDSKEENSWQTIEQNDNS